MATGIRDKVAIIGMGCTRFGERWDAGPEDLMLEAFNEALADAGIQGSQIEAAWFGVCLEENNVGKTAGPLAQALRLPRIAATRVENACATGTEALRGAAYAVAAGAYDIVLALGVEKLKDTGYGGLPVRTRQEITPISDVRGSADLIVSNPPYLTEVVYETLAADVRADPRGALVGGTEVHALLVDAASEWLTPDGWLVVEIGATQGDDVRAMFERTLADVEVLPDLAGRDRVVRGRRP